MKTIAVLLIIILKLCLSFIPYSKLGSVMHRHTLLMKPENLESGDMKDDISAPEDIPEFTKINSEFRFKLDNKAIAALSSLLGSFLFLFQHTQPVSGVALINAMAQDSLPLEKALCNGKPTIIDFYADWCESCKAMAPTMRRMETEFAEKVNFVAIDGANSENSDLVGKFRVDGIPHLAFLTKQGEVKTALIGAVPETVLEDEIFSLSRSKSLPYSGYDAFEGESHFPLIEETKEVCKTE
mmetsp:Transcript_17891/g.17961  ORF Transcript_17891/g.17961 Transcript_17891/m.17961 type:complete len:240 (+) Transcript_17891:80-799(+)|eukprot:CAMPEP_0182429372 /NCGR_PEP_ID=MMETSP1167-20130531/27196_1 /TAXON_ID=2988 /ORGANISM="Mallomonas Sp, Strain CCMP3275" /LENGTH=239 /DNA_ID=CAMNT_0024612935 /DNA_START=35 /DNA_END=754 /DNA_ORIENTATION=-